VIIGIMIVDLLCREVHGLKEKRQIVSSIKEKLGNKFNISIIESDYQDLWQRIQLAVAIVSNSKVFVEKVFAQIEDFIFSNYTVELINIEKQYL
jgi:uncharacterized protein YlxP (DUF503 family)